MSPLSSRPGFSGTTVGRYARPLLCLAASLVVGVAAVTGALIINRPARGRTDQHSGATALLAALPVMPAAPHTAGSRPGAVVAMAAAGSGHGSTSRQAPPVGTALAPPAAVSAPSPPPRPARPAAGTAPATGAPAPSSVLAPVVGKVATALGGSGYTFEALNLDLGPVRWNPCTPIHYVTNLAEAPPTAAADVAGAVSRISAATGIQFIDDGSTTEIPMVGRANVASRYGQGWAPLLIAWSHPGESDELPGGGVVGQGSASSTGPLGGPQVYGTGQVAIDAQATAGLAAGFGSGVTMGQLLLHELGHAMGLGHVDDASQIMYPQLVPLRAAAYGSGDRAGLARLGRPAGCTATPKP